jgi:hypothetical protein
VDLDYRGGAPFVVLEDLDGSGEEYSLSLTGSGITEKA